MTSNVPTVRYKTTIYAEQLRSGEISVENYAVNNAIKVMNGSLESVLHLIGYSFQQIKQINRQLAIKYKTQQKSEFDLSYFEDQISDDIKSQRPTRAHVIECDDRLYGVVIDEGKPRICGQISRIIPKTPDILHYRPVKERGIRISLNGNVIQDIGNETEVRELVEKGLHFVIVSEMGSLFVEPKNTSDGHRYDNDLILILGHGFAVIDGPQETPVKWIRTKQDLKTETREVTRLNPNQSIVVSFGAIRFGDNEIKVLGNGSVVNIKNIKEYYLPLEQRY